MKAPLMLVAACVAVPSFAQDLEDPPTPLDPLVVTATRTEQWQSQAIASIDVISRTDIEAAAANDLADLLRGIAGVDIARSGGPGSPASVFIRGLESNHTLFLVDGVRYTTETFLNAQVQNLAPEMIERIEVVKGPRSGVWGSDAMGGVVNIITRGAAGTGVQGGGSLRTGSYGTRDGSGFLGYRGAAGSFSLGVQGQSFEGYPPLRTGTVDRGHDNFNANVRADVKLGAAVLGGRHMQAGGTNEYVQFGADRSQDFTNQVSGADLSASLAGWDTRAAVSLTRDELLQREASDPARPNLFDLTEVRRKSAEWENRFAVAGVDLTAGVAGSQSEIESVFYSEFGDSRIEDRSDQHAFFGRAELSRGAFDTAVAARRAYHSSYGGFTTGDFAMGYRWGTTRLGLATGTGFKEPELTDLYGDFGNPDLEPERSASIEVNLRHSIDATQVLTLAAFQTIASNLIVFGCIEQCDDPDFLNDVYGLDNVERSRIRGLEAGWRLYDGTWDLGLSGSMQNPINETTHGVLPRRARRSVQAHAGGTFGAWSARIEALGYGQRTDTGDVRLHGYALVNTSAGYAFSPHWSVQVRVDNVLDHDYELVSGFRTPDRNGSVTVRASF